MTSTDTDRTTRPAGRDRAGDTGEYRAPVDDILLALDVAGLPDVLALPHYDQVDPESVVAAVEGFARLASEVIAPTDRVGDLLGSGLDASTSGVRTPEPFHRAYGKYVEGGWGALPFPAEFGGGGFPTMVGLAVQEMFASANLALSLNPVLTQGAIEALLHWGSADQRSTWLPRLLIGEWTGTMNLTEPDAGSDLGEIRTLARSDGRGGWQVSGTKTFITWGEHDLTENIVHLVLARTPGAPAGTKGLSLFIVPRRLLTDDGQPGASNAVHCIHVEKKLGIHGSPTCAMAFEGAAGELVGPLHGGMRAMFTMMNEARLSIGMQGPAVAERSFQQARAYAANRLQGRAAGVQFPDRSPIIDHPDVRRMLLTMSTGSQAGRLLLYTAKAFGDRGRHDPDELAAARAQQFVDLLTPVAKAWSTDLGVEAASLGIQVMGGAGYLEESGMAQHLRDARIAPIYEGTNGIQALDLVARKLPRHDGRWVRELLSEISGSIPRPVGTDHPLRDTYQVLNDALGILESTTEWMLARLTDAPGDALAGATPYLELFGITVGGWLMARRAELAIESAHSDQQRIIGESNFFGLEVMARASGLVRPIMSGGLHLQVPLPGEFA